MKKRKKTLKQIVSVLMAMVMILLATPLTGIFGMGMEAFAKEMSVTSTASAGSLTDYNVGDIIEFGSYPQTRVTDPSICTLLNDKNLTWKSYGYYSGTGTYGTMVQGDWMKYADATLDGVKYRAVKFSQYRPKYTYYSSNSSSSNQKNNGYIINTVYWFKYEPLKWRVLDPRTGLIMCEQVIDAQAYCNTVYRYETNRDFDKRYYKDASYTYYAKNYDTSTIRVWLNDDFYNLAFSNSEKQYIRFVRELDCSPGKSTDGYVFLMSKNEMMTPEYGFSSSSTVSHESRRTTPTDYAKAQGCYPDTMYNDVYNQLLRTSADSIYCGSVCTVYRSRFYEVEAGDTSVGIRPAIRVPNLPMDKVPVKSVTVNPSELTLSSGDRSQLRATVLPENATNKNVTWKSDRTDVAVVDENGVVTAKIPGTATITATTEDRALVATCVVTVIEKIYVNGVGLYPTNKSLYVGETYWLTATVNPSGATNKNIIWSSNNNSVATVNSSGKITAVSEGTATITATTVDGGYTATCVVTVSSVSVKGITINSSSKTLTVGGTYQLTASVSPSNASNKDVVWKSNNTSVATVDSTGYVRAVSEGTATITVTTKDGGYTATCVVTVLNSKVTGVDLISNTEMIYNRSEKLYFDVSTVGNPDYTYKFTSSNNSVATVDNYGNVSSVGKGTARITITITDENGNVFTDTCDVTVKFNFGQWLLFIFCFGWIWM